MKREKGTIEVIFLSALFSNHPAAIEEYNWSDFLFLNTNTYRRLRFRRHFDFSLLRVHQLGNAKTDYKLPCWRGRSFRDPLFLIQTHFGIFYYAHRKLDSTAMQKPLVS